MPADYRLVCFSNANIVGTTTSPAVDIGMGGTPVTSPLVLRYFWTSIAATTTISVNVEASYDNTNFRTVASGAFSCSPLADPMEMGVRFITRRRYVRATITGGTVNGVTAQVVTASRNSPEMYLD